MSYDSICESFLFNRVPILFSLLIAVVLLLSCSRHRSLCLSFILLPNKEDQDGREEITQMFAPFLITPASTRKRSKRWKKQSPTSSRTLMKQQLPVSAKASIVTLLLDLMTFSPSSSSKVGSLSTPSLLTSSVSFFSSSCRTLVCSHLSPFVNLVVRFARLLIRFHLV